MRDKLLRIGTLILAGSLMEPHWANADVTLTLTGAGVTSDTTIYSDLSNDNAGGTPFNFAGQTVTHGFRRTLLRFDLSSIPTNATVVSATLTLQVTRVPGALGTVNHAVHRLTASWVEGTVVGSGAGGQAIAGTTSWNSREHPSVPWTTPGGDFFPSASATATLAPVLGPVSWNGTALKADVQAWVTGSQPNYGWIIIGDETVNPSAREYAAKENTTPAIRPSLAVQYTLPISGAENWAEYY
jgi:hypothetical protein